MMNGLVSSGFQLLAHSVFWISHGTQLYLHYIFTTKFLHCYQCYNYDDLYYPQRVVYNALCWGPSADLDKFPGSPLSLNYVSFCNGEFSFVNCEQRSCLHVHRSHKYLCFIWLFSQAIESKDTPQYHRDTNSLRSFFNIFFYYFSYDRWFTLKWFDRYYPRLKEKKKLV